MDLARRNALKVFSAVSIAAAGSVIGLPMTAFAADWKAASFEAKGLENALKELGVDSYTISSDVSVSSAEIAENGAVVPVSVASAIPNTEYMAVLIEKNPNPLSVAFNIPAGTEAAFTTRVKMGETSNIYALVKANGKWFAASKEVKVTLGGCGG
jgi:sulfur-oxidizing protein SoxY